MSEERKTVEGLMALLCDSINGPLYALEEVRLETYARALVEQEVKAERAICWLSVKQHIGCADDLMAAKARIAAFEDEGPAPCAECLEQARIIGMSAERELALRAVIAEMLAAEDFGAPCFPSDYQRGSIGPGIGSDDLKGGSNG